MDHGPGTGWLQLVLYCSAGDDTGGLIDTGKERRVVGQQSRQGKPGTMASPEFVACLGNTGELDISGA